MGSVVQQRRVVLEGNIGAGKTSLGRLLEILAPDTFRFYPEPVEQWRLEGGAHVLDAFYQKLPGAGFLAQSLISQTLLLRDTALPLPPVVGVGLYERSLLSAQKCFLPTMLAAGLLSRAEAEVLNRGFGFNSEHWPRLVSPDQTVYVRCDPMVCWDRIEERAEVEQGQISLDYLLRLHQRHESWLGTAAGEVIVVDTTRADMLSLAQTLVTQLSATPFPPSQIFPTED